MLSSTTAPQPSPGSPGLARFPLPGLHLPSKCKQLSGLPYSWCVRGSGEQGQLAGAGVSKVGLEPGGLRGAELIPPRPPRTRAEIAEVGLSLAGSSPPGWAAADAASPTTALQLRPRETRGPGSLAGVQLGSHPVPGVNEWERPRGERLSPHYCADHSNRE